MKNRKQLSVLCFTPGPDILYLPFNLIQLVGIDTCIQQIIREKYLRLWI